MNRINLAVGIVVTLAFILFGTALFLVGNQHKAFRRHIDFYTELTNVEGIGKGAKVRVDGMDGGQVQDLIIPLSPGQKFRLKMTIDERLLGLVREDSIVSVETEGLVGDRFLLIRNGTERSPIARPGFTLAGKEPFEIGKMLEQANGLLTQVSSTVSDVQGKLDGTLNALTGTVKNANGLVSDVRSGRGTAGVLLEDPETAAQVKNIVATAQQATADFNATAGRLDGIMQDVQQRQLVSEVDDTLRNAKSATANLDEAAKQVNTTLQSAFAKDQYGQDAGANLQQSLTNVNEATGNLADDTEALKHEFFFKGFFKKRGYDNLDHLPLEPYRSGTLLRKVAQSREWIEASQLFQQNSDGTETLSLAGQAQLNEAASRIQALYDSPLLVEGYADGTAGQAMVRSRERAKLVRTYLEVRFQVIPKNTGILGLSQRPPVNAGKTTWNGICLVHLARMN